MVGETLFHTHWDWDAPGKWCCMDGQTAQRAQTGLNLTDWRLDRVALFLTEETRLCLWNYKQLPGLCSWRTLVEHAYAYVCRCPSKHKNVTFGTDTGSGILSGRNAWTQTAMSHPWLFSPADPFESLNWRDTTSILMVFAVCEVSGHLPL